jgi:hypothetical protein
MNDTLCIREERSVSAAHHGECALVVELLSPQELEEEGVVGRASQATLS